MNVEGGTVDENRIEQRTGDTSSYEMREQRSHNLRNLIVPRMSAITKALYIPFVPLSLFPF